jgi:hypothetical protein
MAPETLSNEKKRRLAGTAVEGAICGQGAESQANPALCRRVKSYPAPVPAAAETTGTVRPRPSFQTQNQTEERVMYIGLGGLLILILILWLLGVI